MNDFFKFPGGARIYLSPEDDSGSSTTNTPANVKEESVQSNNKDIKDISGSITNPKGKQEKGPKSRHIGYFEEDIDRDAGDGTAPAPQKADADDLGVDADDLKDTGSSTDVDEGDRKDPPQKASDDDDKVGDDDDDGDNKFYKPDPERDVYPNEFETRMDAQFAISAKVDTFDKNIAELEENNSGLGAAVDPDIVERIESYRDLDYANSVDDDQLRADIADIDEGLKAVNNKNDRIKNRTQKKQRTESVEKKYKESELKAAKSSKEIGLPERLSDLPDDPSKEDLLGLVDEQINTVLSDIDSEIEEHQSSEEFLEKHGLSKYNKKLSELQGKRQEAMNELTTHKDNIDTYWDAQEEYRTTKDSKPKELTPQQKAQKYDNAFMEFQDDRSEGPNALDIFTKSKDTTPIVHFRQYALKNSDNFDLTTPGGWVKAHKDWKGWIKENMNSNKINNQKKKQQDKKKPPIKKPSTGANRNQIIPAGDSFNKLKEVNNDIGELARKIMKGGQ